MARLARAVIAGSIVACGASAACSLLVDESGLTGGGADAGDASNASDTGASDASALDSGVDADGSLNAPDAFAPFTCALVDASFCDDFNRDAAIAMGTPWSSLNCNPGGALSVDGTLVTSFVATSGFEPCFLQSLSTSESAHFSLEFDMVYTTDNTSTAPIVVAAVTNQLASANESGMMYEAFQLLVDGTGTGGIGVSFYYPDAGASPMQGNSYPYYNLALATPFVTEGAPCHIAMAVDALTPAVVSAKATCGGTERTMTALPSGSPAGIAAPTSVILGYTDTGNTVPAWSITYDNMIFDRSP